MKKDKIRAIDLSALKTVSLQKRKSKIQLKDFARRSRRGEPFFRFLDSFPNILAAAEFRQAVKAMLRARRRGRRMVWMMGAHAIKCGLSPLLIDLMEQGFVSAFCVNGAAAIHDFELAFCGKTSEEVETGIRDGSFGMSRETAEFFNHAAAKAAGEQKGLGEITGSIIRARKLKFSGISIQAAAAKAGVPLTIHVAVGTDIFHPHPDCDGRALGEAAMRDFRRFMQIIAGINGGVVLNVGSAVIMPEVFLKAVSAARNLGFGTDRFTAVCFDMIKHYRPWQNIVTRPTAKAGQGYYLIGHHELMIPLFYRALIEGAEDA